MLVLRSHDALLQLRDRVEQQSDRQQRLQAGSRACRRHNSSNCVAMDRQLTILEGLLRAWMRHSRDESLLSIVADAPHGNPDQN